MYFLKFWEIIINCSGTWVELGVEPRAVFHLHTCYDTLLRSLSPAMHTYVISRLSDIAAAAAASNIVYINIECCVTLHHNIIKQNTTWFCNKMQLVCLPASHAPHTLCETPLLFSAARPRVKHRSEIAKSNLHSLSNIKYISHIHTMSRNSR